MTELSHGHTKSRSTSSMYAKRSTAELEAIEAKATLAAIKKAEKEARKPMVSRVFNKPIIVPHIIDWARLVSLDFETYYDAEYTLSKMSTSEYIRDPRFKAQMMGIKIGNKKTKIIPAAKIRWELLKIDWNSHAVLAHNAQFDALILSEHYGVHPHFIYDSLAMARGIHSNEIGSGLDEVSQFYGGQGKIAGSLDKTKGVRIWDKQLYAEVADYCVRDVDEMFRVFQSMAPKLPDDEFKLIDIITRMFTSPVLKVDIPRVEKELARELLERKTKMLAAVNPRDWDGVSGILKGKEKELVGEERDMLIIKRVIGSNEKFADLIRKEGLEPPVKISPAWIKNKGEGEKYAYAFAKDDPQFLALPEESIQAGFNLKDPNDIQKMAAKQARVQSLVDVRIAVKSTTNITRAERFLSAGKDGMALPVGYAYSRAHTHRLGGNNKMNMQNLTRGGELRLSILAPAGHQLAVVDSGQIEARVNGWLWGQHELIKAFRTADLYEAQQAALPESERKHATGNDRDAYCIFGDTVYGWEVTKANKTERFVGKVCIAEGELVLTDRGLVPINLISKEDRLWDGIEWVTHDGVIDQGIREVITYDGLTATPDHEVFTEDGRIISLGQAASEMVRLQRTGAEGQSIRFCDDHVVADTPRKRLSVRVGPLQSEWGQETNLPQQPEERQDDIVPQEWAQAGASRRGLGATIRRYLGTLYESFEQTLDKLRGPRHSVPIQWQDGVHPVGGQEPGPRELRPGGNRPDRQRRALCAREFEVGYAGSTEPQQTQHPYDSLARAACLDPRVPQSLESDVHLQAVKSRDDGRADLRKVRTFDIVNAGPRRRYTVSGKLCLNCVLGLGFQMGAPKFQLTLAKGALGGPPVYFSEEQCKEIVYKYRDKNYMIVRGWGICDMIIKDMIAGNKGSHGPLNWEKDRIWLPNGMCLHYPDIRVTYDEDGRAQYSYRSGVMWKKIYGGLLCENIVQALARIIVMWQMLQISKKYRCVMTTHDEVVAMVKTSQAKSAFAYMMKCMTTAPDWCKDIPLNAEGGFDVRYSK